MSSRATRAAIAIISIANGVGNTLLKEKAFSRLDMMGMVEEFNSDCVLARNSYCRDYTEKDIEWTVQKMGLWNDKLTDLGFNEQLSTSVLVTIAVYSINDLYDKLQNNHRKSLLEPMLDPLGVFHNFIDPEGKSFFSYEDSNKILNALYEEIGFEPS